MTVTTTINDTVCHSMYLSNYLLKYIYINIIIKSIDLILGNTEILGEEGQLGDCHFLGGRKLKFGSLCPTLPCTAALTQLHEQGVSREQRGSSRQAKLSRLSDTQPAAAAMALVGPGPWQTPPHLLCQANVSSYSL